MLEKVMFHIGVISIEAAHHCPVTCKNCVASGKPSKKGVETNTPSTSIKTKGKSKGKGETYPTKSPTSSYTQSPTAIGTAVVSNAIQIPTLPPIQSPSKGGKGGKGKKYPTPSPTQSPTVSQSPTQCMDNPGIFLVPETAGNMYRACDWVSRMASRCKNLTFQRRLEIALSPVELVIAKIAQTPSPYQELLGGCTNRVIGSTPSLIDAENFQRQERTFL